MTELTDVAKIPHPKDMDTGYGGQFIQHWQKRHYYEGVFSSTHIQFPNDDTPLWSAIKALHNRIHEGKTEFPLPEDHVHLEPLDRDIAKLLEELL